MKFATQVCAGTVFLCVGCQSYPRTAEQFDLACMGTRTTTDASTSKREDWAVRYSIDLATRKFCAASKTQVCAAPMPINRIDSDRIVLSDKTVMIGSARIGGAVWVSRRDGTLHAHDAIPNTYAIEVEARCASVPFTPLPN